MFDKVENEYHNSVHILFLNAFNVTVLSVHNLYENSTCTNHHMVFEYYI